MSEQEPFTWTKAHTVRTIVWTLALLAGTVIGLAWGGADYWGKPELGPVAAWVAGILTAGALLIAAYQASLARRAAADADRRLTEQLKATHRSEQVNVVADMWSHVGSLRGAVHDVSSAMFIFKDQGRSAYDTFQTGDPTDLALERYRNKIAELDAAITRALMVVEEPNTRKIVNYLNGLRSILDAQLWVAVGDIFEEGDFNFAETEAALEGIQNIHGTLVSTVHQNLVLNKSQATFSMQATSSAEVTRPSRPTEPTQTDPPSSS
ncbi:hypothetical protein [Williamsia limnetica]|nr:hypothetical protein [Williamsia limnetica]